MAVDKGGESTFSRRLSALKQRGCNLLVVNDSHSAGHVCQRLLGEPALARRHLFVPTTATVSSVLGRHDPHPADPSMLGVVDATGAHRPRTGTATTAHAGTVDPATEWYTAVDDLTDLSGLLDATTDHIDRLTADDPGPSTLRVCLESVDPLFDAVPLFDLFQFLHALTGRVRRERGIGHVHAAAGVGETELAAIEPLFDVTVRTRTDEDGTVWQRWRDHETGEQSEWLQLG
ncbi:hypothetical protein ACFQH6_05545 [Halobacteriaceae archaeon GCM10025711]